MKTLTFSLVVGILCASLALAGELAPVPAAPQSFNSVMQTGAPIPMGDTSSNDSYSYTVPMQVVATRTINTHFEGTPPTIQVPAPCAPCAPQVQTFSAPAPCNTCGPPAQTWTAPGPEMQTSTYSVSEGCVGPQCGPEDSDGSVAMHAGGGFGDGGDVGPEQTGLFSGWRERRAARRANRGGGLFGNR